MMRQERKGFSLFSDESGFTLIEMAIVLIIIGIIIGAVVKGKDIIRSGEQKKLYSTFISAWETTYSSYYDRTGWILGDTDTPDNSGTRNGQCSLATGTNLDAQLAAVGLESPVQGQTGVSNVRTYTDSAGNFATLTIQFGYNAAHGNYLQMAAIPTELGLAIDRMVDGQMDGTVGNFLYIPVSGVTMPTGGWPPLAATAPLGTSLAILRLPF